MNLDSAIVARYYQDVPGADSSTGQYMFPCNVSLPNLTLTIGGNGPVTLPGHVLNYHPSTSDPNSKRARFLNCC